MKRKKSPFEEVVSQITDLISFIDKKGFTVRKEGISEENMREIEALLIIAKDYRESFDDAIKKADINEVRLPGQLQFIEKETRREKRFSEQLNNLKRELLTRKRAVHSATLEKKKRSTAPSPSAQEPETTESKDKPLATKDKKKPRKKSKNKPLKKFRGIGGKEGWLPL